MRTRRELFQANWNYDSMLFRQVLVDETIINIILSIVVIEVAVIGNWMYVGFIWNRAGKEYLWWICNGRYRLMELGRYTHGEVSGGCWEKTEKDIWVERWMKMLRNMKGTGKVLIMYFRKSILMGLMGEIWECLWIFRKLLRRSYDGAR